MPKDDVIQMQGAVLEHRLNATSRMKLESGHWLPGHIAGKRRMHCMRNLPGEKVTVGRRPYNPTWTHTVFCVR